MFQFKQFIVHDEQCGMKVGTDGTLLGAWCPIPDGCKRILDIGTGSGLIAMMLAQRTTDTHADTIDAIDIDADAVEQAAENFAATPWQNRLHVCQSALQDWQTQEHTDTVTSDCGQYDLIVSNPPYFVNSLKNPDAARQAARHTDTLSFEDLTTHSARLLREGGIAAYILTADAETAIRHAAAACGLTPIHITRVHTRAGKPAKRILIALRANGTPRYENKTQQSGYGNCKEDDLCLIGANGEPRSAEYQALCRDFYL